MESGKKSGLTRYEKSHEDGRRSKVLTKGEERRDLYALLLKAGTLRNAAENVDDSKITN